MAFTLCPSLGLTCLTGFGTSGSTVQGTSLTVALESWPCLPSTACLGLIVRVGQLTEGYPTHASLCDAQGLGGPAQSCLQPGHPNGFSSPTVSFHTDSSSSPVIPCRGFIWSVWNHGLSFIPGTTVLEAELCVIRGGVGFSSYSNEASPKLCCSQDSEPKVATLSRLQIINDSSQLTSGSPGLLLISSLHPALLQQALETAVGQMTVLAYG